ncbi:MAG: lamin tail domain-containing protein [Phycisphaera sp.]|nr:MAG: lamin tail domain-containing protein [Phycisphaera sp.]
MKTSNRISTLLAACGLAGVAASASAQSIAVTEIMYNPAFDSNNEWEYVEIMNTGGSAIDLTGWVLDDEGGAPITAANIPGGMIPAGGTAVLYNSALTLATVEAAWGTGINFIAVDDWQALNNGGDTFGLWDSITSHAGRDFGAAVVAITYDDGGDWPADDGVASIYLGNPFVDGNVGTNWALSTDGVDGGYVSAPAGAGPDTSVGSPGTTPADTALQGPFLINISGATLFASFFEAPASTNDYLDPDLDGFARRIGPGIDQLAPGGQRKSTYDADAHWIVTDRSTGSVQGFREFVLTNDPDGPFAATGFYDTTRDDDNPAIGLEGSVAENAFANREVYIDEVSGPVAGVFNAGNPGGSPFRSLTDGTFRASPFTFPSTSAIGGVRIDLGVLDVPASWAVTISGTGALDANPGTVGYGDSGILARDKDGNIISQGNSLADLGGLKLFDPANPPAVTASDTIFDTPIAFVPIAPIVNYGVGLEQIDQSDLRYGNATGRRSNGENLVFVTRDSGSGTRNGFQNSIGLDPSWGRGENVGERNNRAEFNLLGPDFLPGNKGGSGSLDSTVINHRLAIGHTGAERASRWFFNGRADVLAVRNDLQGGTAFSRPTIDNVLDNNADGWTIGGPETFTSIGSPRAVSPSVGGQNGTGLPPMENEQAAAYLNNITASISAFEDDPSVPEVEFTPAEFLARNFTLIAATDFIQDTLDPLNQIANPDFNQSLQDFIRANSIVLGDPRFATFGGSGFTTGLVPTRTTGVTYSDGVAGGGNYVDQAGNTVFYGDRVTDRNSLAGDFNNDGVRNIGDTAAMIGALEDRASFEPGSDAVLEIIGDFNGDGNFDAEDARYFADGLALDTGTGMLDRVAGFEMVDVASTTGNFFNTMIGDGSISYEAGWSRFDVSNIDGLTTPGWSPSAGADGIVDAFDRAYIAAQISAVDDGEANWDDISEAVLFDLSADVTGDLIVNQDDLDAIDAILGGTGCRADLDGDGVLTLFDFLAFQNAFDSGDLLADFDGDGSLTLFDFLAFQNEFDAGC